MAFNHAVVPSARPCMSQAAAVDTEQGSSNVLSDAERVPGSANNEAALGCLIVSVLLRARQNALRKTTTVPFPPGRDTGV